MSQGTHQLSTVENLNSGIFGASSGGNQGIGGHNDRELWDKIPTSLDTTIDSDASAPGRFRLSDRCVEEFWHSDAIEHFAHLDSSALVVGAQLARQYATTALALCASELSFHTWEKAAFRISADVPTWNIPEPAVNRFTTGRRSCVSSAL